MSKTQAVKIFNRIFDPLHLVTHDPRTPTQIDPSTRLVGETGRVNSADVRSIQDTGTTSNALPAGARLVTSPDGQQRYVVDVKQQDGSTQPVDVTPRNIPVGPTSAALRDQGIANAQRLSTDTEGDKAASRATADQALAGGTAAFLDNNGALAANTGAAERILSGDNTAPQTAQFGQWAQDQAAMRAAANGQAPSGAVIRGQAAGDMASRAIGAAGPGLAGLHAGMGAASAMGMQAADAVGRGRLGELSAARGQLGASNAAMSSGLQGAHMQGVSAQDAYAQSLLRDAAVRLQNAQGKNAILANDVNNRLGIANATQTENMNERIAEEAAKRQYMNGLLNRYQMDSGQSITMGAGQQQLRNQTLDAQQLQRGAINAAVGAGVSQAINSAQQPKPAAVNGQPGANGLIDPWAGQK